MTRFVRERTVLMKFRHPAVVTVNDMIMEGDRDLKPANVLLDCGHCRVPGA